MPLEEEEEDEKEEEDEEEEEEEEEEDEREERGRRGCGADLILHAFTHLRHGPHPWCTVLILGPVVL